MKKRFIGGMLAAIMALNMMACTLEQGGSMSDGNFEESGEGTESSAANVENEIETDSAENFRIGIVTGSFSQSEDDRRGAEAFRDKYGEDSVTLVLYPDNFTEEYDVTVQTIVNLAEDPRIKVIIVNQAVDGTTEAFRKIKEMRPDIICIAGEAYEDFADIGEVADLVVSCDFVSRGYLMIRTAH